MDSSIEKPDFGGIAINEAREGTESEQNMTLREGLKLYPKAMAWSVLFSTAIIMEGFGIVLLGSFYAFPQFVLKFGDLNPDGTTTISPAWQAGLSNGALIGQIFGLWLNGIVSERYGYRRTMIVALALMAATVTIPFVAPNIVVLLIGELAMGCCWGVFQTLAPAYASEVCPVQLRGYLTTYVNLCWVMGQLLASGVLRALLDRQDDWAYRIPFALQWIWPLPIAIGCFLAPESPWWLVRHGKQAEARNTLLRLTRAKAGDKNFNVDATLAMITHTNELEKSASAGTSYFDCFKGVDRRRTEIACAAWMTQNLCGSAFMGYSTFFLTQAGLPSSSAFTMSLAQYALGAIGTIGSWVLLSHVGRRNLYIGGLAIMSCLLFIIGFLGIAPEGNTSATWAVGGMLLVYTFVYDITVGPVCYAIVAEISSTRLRSKTIVLARLSYNLVGVVNSVIMPYFLSEQALNWKAKTGFFWAGWATLCGIYCYYRLPESKGKTYGELDMLFLKKVRARDFKTTAVDQYKEDDTTGSVDETFKKTAQIEHLE